MSLSSSEAEADPGGAMGPLAPLAEPDTRAPPGDAAMLAATLDALPMHVCVLDEQARVLWVNQAWRDFAGANGGDPDASYLGQSYLGVCDAASGDEAQDAQEVGSLIRRVLGGRQAGGEVEYPCHGPQTLRWFVVQVSRLPGNGPARVVVSHLPVTERRLADARQRETQRLESLGALAAGVAHDFNNVLSAVLGNAALAQRDLAPAHPARAALVQIQRAADRARGLVRRVLAFGHRDPSRPAPMAMVPLVEETLALLRVSQPAGLRMRTEITRQPLWVCADASELQHLLMNLCTNAWLAMSAQGGTLTVGLDASGGTGQVHLWVQDDGVGMSEAVMARCFEPFFTTRPAGEGTGLGLSQVRTTAQRWGGRVEVESTPGAGSTFHVHLPACEPPQADALAPADAPHPVGQESAGRALPAAGAPLAGPAPAARVLLVDDDEVVGLTLQAVLEREGHQVVRHRSGPEALDWLATGPAVDVVVTDQSMPTMSGTELCRQLRAGGRGWPVVVVTGYVSEDLRQQAAGLGVVALVPKEEAFERLPAAVARATAAAPT